jgi:hypothetical protein
MQEIVSESKDSQVLTGGGNVISMRRCRQPRGTGVDMVKPFHQLMALHLRTSHFSAIPIFVHCHLYEMGQKVVKGLGRRPTMFNAPDGSDAMSAAKEGRFEASVLSSCAVQSVQEWGRFRMIRRRNEAKRNPRHPPIATSFSARHACPPLDSLRSCFQLIGPYVTFLPYSLPKGNYQPAFARGRPHQPARARGRISSRGRPPWSGSSSGDSGRSTGRTVDARVALAFQDDLVAALGGEAGLSPQRRKPVEMAARSSHRQRAGSPGSDAEDKHLSRRPTG